MSDLIVELPEELFPGIVQTVLNYCSFGHSVILESYEAGTVVQPNDLKRIEVAEVLYDLGHRHKIEAVQDDRCWH